MPDATYVGAGMPCGNCGNPLTLGQPHKCGRTPDQPRDDGTHGTRWLAGKLPPDKEVVLAHHYDDLLAAALPDERLREADRKVILEWAKFTRDESAGYWGKREEDVYQRLLAAAAPVTPDTENQRWTIWVCPECGATKGAEAEWRDGKKIVPERASRWCGPTHEHPRRKMRPVEVVAAGRAAAHPDPPECRAPHCWSEYGTPCGDCPTLASARKDAGSASNPGDGDHAASPDERDGER